MSIAITRSPPSVRLARRARWRRARGRPPGWPSRARRRPAARRCDERRALRRRRRTSVTRDARRRGPAGDRGAALPDADDARRSRASADAARPTCACAGALMLAELAHVAEHRDAPAAARRRARAPRARLPSTWGSRCTRRSSTDDARRRSRAAPCATAPAARGEAGRDVGERHAEARRRDRDGQRRVRDLVRAATAARPDRCPTRRARTTGAARRRARRRRSGSRRPRDVAARSTTGGRRCAARARRGRVVGVEHRDARRRRARRAARPTPRRRPRGRRGARRGRARRW